MSSWKSFTCRHASRKHPAEYGWLHTVMVKSLEDMLETAVCRWQEAEPLLRTQDCKIQACEPSRSTETE